MFPGTAQLEEERIQKILSRAGFGSRRMCEELIRQGRVTVNGRKVVLGAKADSEKDVIRVDGERVRIAQERRYIVLYKPRGVLSSLSDPEGRKTLRDLVPISGHWYPVGRLDFDSEGLMLLTDDGDLAHKLTHPRYQHQKIYVVLVHGVPSSQSLARLRRGVVIEGGYMTAPARISLLHEPPRGLPPMNVHARGATAWVKVTLHEGRKRQIRHMMAAVGHPVLRLVRIGLGPLPLHGLKPGQWRHLTKAEIRRLKESVSGR